ncbi:hypothetical protein ACIGZJ_30840 [Kitasatospora sp. NPDC052868]|uniref:hypothetical protein n=1 Tax=Kitasatospora sp. NPDC052868 TaxID=3364060 RepID=UPI0037CB9D1B
MPASAHPDEVEPARGPAPATVIDLASRRRSDRPRADVPEQEVPVLEDAALVALFEEQGGGGGAVQASMIAAAWERAVGEQGSSLRDPAAAAAVRGVALLMERMLYGGMAVRHGDPVRGIEANPADGIDEVGAQMMLDLVHGLREAADFFSPECRERM